MRRARRLREEMGLSLRAIEKELDDAGTPIDHSMLGKFETGEADLTLSKLEQLAAFYSERLARTISIGDLAEREGAAAGA